MVTVHAPTCVVCQHAAIIELPESGYAKWRAGADVQVAFPELNSDERELLISGTHAHCWYVIFGDEEDDEEDDCHG